MKRQDVPISEPTPVRSTRPITPSRAGPDTPIHVYDLRPHLNSVRLEELKPESLNGPWEELVTVRSKKLPVACVWDVAFAPPHLSSLVPSLSFTSWI